MDFDAYVKEPLPFLVDLRKYFKKYDRLTIFEIGSCEGEDTIRLKYAFPNAKIYTFEALPKNVEIINHNLKKYGLGIDKVFQLALSDKKGVSDFFVSSGHPDQLPKQGNWDYGNKSSSLLRPKEHKKLVEWIKFRKKIPVQTSRIDIFCQDNSIERIDFVYIDVQGAELMVLEGAGKILKNIGAIWLEVEAVELYEGQPLKQDVEKFMTDNNFIKVKDTVDSVSGDQLYINQRLAEKNRSLRELVFKRNKSR